MPELLLLTKEVQVKDVGTCRFAWGFRRITLQGLKSRLGEAAWKEGDFNFLFIKVCLPDASRPGGTGLGSWGRLS